MAKIAIPRSNKNSSAKDSGASSASQYDEMQKLAFQLFQERGCEHGHDLEDWARAESIIKSRRS